MLKSAVVAAALLAVMTSAVSAQAKCGPIKDPAARLACYDKAPASKAKRGGPDQYIAAKTAILRKLKDPESVQWRDLFTVDRPTGPVICGSVNSKNSMGGYVGFRGFIYERAPNMATIMMSGASDPEYTVAAAAAYCIYCVPDPRAEKSVAPHCPGLIASTRRSRR